jgi:hypothetical protein
MIIDLILSSAINQRRMRGISLINTTENGVAQYAAWRHHLKLILAYDFYTEHFPQHSASSKQHFISLDIPVIYSLLKDRAQNKTNKTCFRRPGVCPPNPQDLSSAALRSSAVYRGLVSRHRLTFALSYRLHIQYKQFTDIIVLYSLELRGSPYSYEALHPPRL